MFSRPKFLFLVSLLFVALLNPKFNPYLLFKFLIFYHSSIYRNCTPIINAWQLHTIHVQEGAWLPGSVIFHQARDTPYTTDMFKIDIISVQDLFEWLANPWSFAKVSLHI